MQLQDNVPCRRSASDYLQLTFVNDISVIVMAYCRDPIFVLGAFILNRKNMWCTRMKLKKGIRWAFVYCDL